MKKSLLILFASALFSLVQVSAYADSCLFAGIAGACKFDSLTSNSSPHAYFHCEADNSFYVKIYTHNVLVGGFGPEGGKLTLLGSEINKVLKHYYFEVAHDDRHKGTRFIAVTSMGPVRCSLGTGGRTAVYPGAFANNPLIQ